jgi:hypothetical protein
MRGVIDTNIHLFILDYGKKVILFNKDNQRSFFYKDTSLSNIKTIFYIKIYIINLINNNNKRDFKELTPTTRYKQTASFHS